MFQHLAHSKGIKLVKEEKKKKILCQVLFVITARTERLSRNDLETSEEDDDGVEAIRSFLKQSPNICYIVTKKK